MWCVPAVAFQSLEPASPKRTALELQQASIRTQKESVERQLTSIRPRLERKATRVSASTGISFTAPDLAALEIPPFPASEVTAEPSFAQLDCPAISRSEADNMIFSAAKEEDISASLLRAVIKRESAFHPCAVSEKGALGLMQLMPSTAEQFGVVDPFDARQNVRGGAAFLKQLLNRFGGDVRLALGAYNAGPERVDAAGGIPDIAETQSYVSSIATDLGFPAAEAAPVTNAMAKPDLRHLTLAPPGLTFSKPATEVHLITGQ